MSAAMHPQHGWAAVGMGGTDANPRCMSVARVSVRLCRTLHWHAVP